MPYTLYKTNGIKLTTVEDGTLNLTTDLNLVGKNYAGYGQVVNQNLVKLLENFANNSAPANPLAGQIWYDSLVKKLKFYTGTKWNQLVTANISGNRPTDLANGEFWFDSSLRKLYIKNNDTFVLIGPGTGGSGTSGTSGSIGTTQVLSDTTISYDVIPLAIGDTVEAIVSPFSFTVDANDPIVTQFTKIKNGITLQGADPVTGISSSTNMYFWGTASDAMRLAGKPSTDYLLASQVSLIAGDISSLGNITFISSGSPTTAGSIEGAWQLTAGSTLQATFADLAERYAADALYGPGTVLVLGGANEVTITTERASVAVAGIVSTNPAFKLNSEVGTDRSHPYIALKGRVPCKVVGPVAKGELLVTSRRAGYAEAAQMGDSPNAVIGKALEDFKGSEGVIEVKV